MENKEGVDLNKKIDQAIRLLQVASGDDVIEILFGNTDWKKFLENYFSIEL